MHFNVATLLQEPVGSMRVGTLTDELVRVAPSHADALGGGGDGRSRLIDGYERRISGSVRLIRTSRGVLVQARLHLDAPVICARCLRETTTPLDLKIDEEYVPLHDMHTGRRLEAEPDEFRIDDRHYLDLSEAVRQYEQTALPLQPVCRPDCAGLCPVCGRDRNDGPCHEDRETTPAQWSALAGLAERLRAEETDGGSQA